LPNVIGQRYNLAPAISTPIYGASYHFVPQLQYDVTAYQLQNTLPGQKTELSREVPIFDIDSGLYFQRNTNLFGKNYYQTFEPRLYYVYIPYRDQTELPVFDASTQTFTYDSLFENNRFTSIDRIGDSNRLGYGFTTEFINKDTGIGQLSASIGQIFYFQDRQVTLPDINNSILSNTSKTSPIVGQLTMYLFQNWYASGNAAWLPQGQRLNNAGLSLEYIKNTQDTFSLTYNFLKDGDPLPNDTDEFDSRNDLDQLRLASSWKIHQRWGLYGSLNYNISHHYTQNFLYGVEYNNCCWAIRFVATRNLIGLDPSNNPNYDNGVAIQIALKGLGNVGSNVQSNELNSNIPGYIDEFGKNKIVTT
jgi:LPS-assembly protein